MAEFIHAPVSNFEGGINVGDAPHLAKLRRAQDVVFDGDGFVRMRGGYDDRVPTTVYGTAGTAGTDREEIYGLSRFTMTKGIRGIVATTQDATDKRTRVYYMRDNQEPVELFRHADLDGDGDHRRWRQYQDADGWSPKISETGNARQNVLIMTCRAFTIVLRMRLTDDYTSGSNQFDGSVFDGVETVYWQVTVLLNATGTFKRSTGTDIVVTAKGEGRAEAVGTAGRYTFLAALNGQSQQYVAWSLQEDSDSFSRDGSDPAKFKDVFQVPDEESSDITALKGSGNVLLIFKEHGIYRLNTDASVKAWKLNEPISDVGCYHAESIARWQENHVFANRWGVYLTDSYSVQDISTESIGPLYRSFFQGDPFFNDDWRLTGAIVGDNYILSIVDSDRQAVITWCCHLPTKSWTTFSGFRFTASCRTEAGFGVYAAMKQGSQYRIANIERCFRSSNSNDPYDRGYSSPDAGSPSTPAFVLEVGRLAMENIFQRMWVRQFKVLYECDNTLQMRPIFGHDADALPESDVLYLHEFPATSSVTPGHAVLGYETEAIGWEIKPVGTPTRVVIMGIDVAFRPMMESRTNKVGLAP